MKRVLGVFLLATVPLALACPLKTNTAKDFVAATVTPAGAPTATHTATSTVTSTATPREKEEKDPAPLYLLRDTGKRCIAAPCPSWAAVDVDTRVEREITGIDLAGLSLDAKSAESARRRILAGQVWVHGEIKTVPKQGPAGDGTVLVVTEIVDTDAAPAPR